MKKKILVIIAIIILTCSFTSLLTFANKKKSDILELNDEVKYLKDETVYINLNYDGSKISSNIVNHINTPREGVYIDYGEYTDIKSLSNDFTPKVEGNKIIWQLPYLESGFYYQGTLKDSEVPFEFFIDYKLNGKDIEAEDLIGKSGEVELSIKVESNKRGNQYFLDNYICQLQIPLSLDKAKNINTDGAQSVIVGKTITLAYIILPKQNKDLIISFDANNFEMDSISASIIPFDTMDYLPIDAEGIKSGITEITSGTDDLINGTTQLKEGINELGIGLSKTEEGSKKLENGSIILKEGITNYTDAVSKVNSNMKELSKGMHELSENGDMMNLGYNQLSEGVINLLDSMIPLIDSLPETEKAQYLNSINYLKGGLNNYSEGLNNYINGINDVSQGLDGIGYGLDSIAKENQKLISGTTDINNGLFQLNKGLKEFTIGTSRMPLEIQKIIDGQKQLQDGMTEAVTIFEDFDFTNNSLNNKPISFAENNKNVNSVQFVVRTLELKIPDDLTNVDIEEKNDSFWDRFRELFK